MSHYLKFAMPLCVLLAGCQTSLNTRPTSMATGNAFAGIPYALPALQYDLTVTRTLTKCIGTDQAEFGVKVEPVARYVAGEWFVADYEDLAAPTKISSLAVETYDNQTIKTVNASAEDRSAQIAAGLAQSAFTVARIAMGLPRVEARSSATSPKRNLDLFECPQHLLDAIKLLREGPDGKGGRDKLVRDLAGLNKELDRLTIQTLIATLTEEQKKRIAELRTETAALAGRIEDIDTKIAELSKPLTYVETLEWLPTRATQYRWFEFPEKDGGERAGLQEAWLLALFNFEAKRQAAMQQGATPQAIAAAKGKWLDDHIRPTMRLVATTSATSAPVDPATLCRQAGLDPVKCNAADAPDWNGRSTAARPDAAPGIMFRTPLQATTRVCQNATLDECRTGARPKAVLTRHDALMPQIGRLGVLPFRNGVGSNNALSVAFRADGSISSAKYEDKAAAAETVVTALNSALEGGLGLATDIRAKRNADRAAAEAEAATEAAAEGVELDRQIAIATKQKELLELQAAMDPDNVAAKQEAADLAAKLVRLDTMKKIKELEEQLGQ